jgi:hypothetical protein
MEDITLALITLTSFVLLFVVAIFADRAGMQADEAVNGEPLLVPVDDAITANVATNAPRIDADVA